MSPRLRMRKFLQSLSLRLPGRGRGKLAIWLLLLLVLFLLLKAGAYLRRLSADMALSNASDLVTLAVNETVRRHLEEGQYDYDYFVRCEKDTNGSITAIKTNMARVNTFASEVLRDVVTASDDGTLHIHVPLGNLLGSNLTLGRGPAVPVDILMLTSSYTNFKNELTSSGINQTKHQILLEIVVDIDILIPWQSVSTQVVCETLIAETVIVGQVPETFVNVEG